jgi:hypothetical protein
MWQVCFREEEMMSEGLKWPTLADVAKSWSGTCDKCGEPYPPDTLVNAIWSPTQFFISCRCSLHIWVSMEATTQESDSQ